MCLIDEGHCFNRICLILQISLYNVIMYVTLRELFIINLNENMERRGWIYTVATPFVSSACKRSVRDARNARENEGI